MFQLHIHFYNILQNKIQKCKNSVIIAISFIDEFATKLYDKIKWSVCPKSYCKIISNQRHNNTTARGGVVLLELLYGMDLQNEMHNFYRFSVGRIFNMRQACHKKSFVPTVFLLSGTDREKLILGNVAEN